MAAIAPTRPSPPRVITPDRESPPPGTSWWRRPRLHLLSLLVATAVLYTWNLSASGYGNSFYAAAVQAGTKSWKAFFFGSLDAGNAITVDKPPASLWVMELSGRIFGFNSWSLLVPQALEGVGAVALLYLAVKRVSGHGAGLLAGAALAVTPAAVLMFRFDNPDALLVLLLVAAAYAMTRALETASTRWMLLVGTLLGFGFLTKMGQAFLILPGLALAYLICAPTSLRRRIVQLLVGGAAVVVSAGWYVGVVALVPAADRPYIAGSGNDSVLGLALGYNGLGRLFGGSGNGGGGGGGGSAAGTSFGGATGLSRLFSNEFGLEVSWLLPAALVALVAGLIVTARRARTDQARAGLIVWGGWLLGTGLVLSYMEGTVHPYYTVALAPGIAACVAIGGQLLWSRRSTWLPRIALLAMVVVTAVWTEHLLASDSTFLPWLRYVVALGAAAFVGLLLAGSRLAAQAVAARRITAALAVSGIVVASGGAAWGVATASVAHTGSIPTAGPASAAAGGMGGFGGGFGGGTRTGGTAGTRAFGGGTAPTGGTGGFGGGTAPTGTAPTGTAPTGTAPTGTAPTGTAPTGTAPTGTAPTGTAPSGTTGTTGSAPTGTSAAARTGGMGGDTANSALTALLSKTTTKWAAATVGATGAASYELASSKAVIAIGGWNGSDDAPTLAQFEAMVKAGQISYLIAGGGMGGGAGGSTSAITTWVAAHYTSSTVGGTTVYDLTVAK